MKNKIIYCIIIIAFAITSCKSTRSIINAPLKEQGSSYLFNKLKENELHYKTFKASFSAEYEKNRKKTSIKGTILISKDSIIWGSIGPGLGIELARISIEPDSVKILNKMEGTYLIKNFDFISEMINRGLDYDMLQSLIIGNDFSVYDNSSFKAAVDKNQYRLSTLNRRRLRKLSKSADTLTDVIPFQQIYLDPTSFKISTVNIREIENNNRTFQANYKNYVLINNQLVPQTLEFNVNDGTNRIRITLNYSKIRLDQQQSYPFNILHGYKKVDRF
jgi:lambda repressor-like predicted transcriptional regulator